MAFSVRGGSGAISDINVTPLVDVMLVLLIIFMITATLARPIDEQERLVEMNLPATRDTPQQATSEDDKPILRIDERLTARIDDVVLVDCSEALTRRDRRRFEPCFERFQTALVENERVMTQGEVYILADPVIPYGFVVGILHRIGEAGIPKVGMVTNPEYLRLAADPASPQEGDP